MTDTVLKIALKLTKDVVREFDVIVSVDNDKNTEATAGEKGGEGVKMLEDVVMVVPKIIETR